MDATNFHSYWFGLDNEARTEMARRLDTSPGYLEKLAGGFGAPSAVMAGKLMEITGLGFEDIMAKHRERQEERAARARAEARKRAKGPKSKRVAKRRPS